MKSYTHRPTIRASHAIVAAISLVFAQHSAHAQASLDEAPRAQATGNTSSANGTTPSTDGGDSAGRPRTATLRLGLNRGFSIATADERISLTIRAFVQPRVTVEAGAMPTVGLPLPPPTVAFTVRRARLILQGTLLGPTLGYTLHLGVAPQDISNQSPLFDAFVTWAPSPNFQLRAGQFFVPFNRNRWISIMRQMFIERPVSTNELNLDRDIGVMAFSNDLFAVGGRLGYSLGIFSGGGRNRLDADYGLLYVARFHVNPLGRFEDSDSEWDLRREGPRLAIGFAGAFNHRQLSADSPAGAIPGAPVVRSDRISVEADVMFKWRGFTVQLEALARWHPFGLAFEVTATRSGLGYLAQLGYVTPIKLAFGARLSQTLPVFDPMGRRAFAGAREIAAVIAYMPLDGALNLSLDYTNRDPVDALNAAHTIRLQSMLIF